MKSKVLVVGPTPPPFHGVATFTRDLLAEFQDAQFELLSLDTSDRRDTTNLGQWDPTNVQLGFANLSELAGRCLKSGVNIVYVPISQNPPAFIRDALFILEARALGCEVVIHVHGAYFKKMYEEPHFFGGDEVFRTLVRTTLKATSAAIVLAEEFRPMFKELLPDEKVFVVENGVPDCGAWEIRQARKRATGETLLYMGTLMRTKGVFGLIQAAAILRNSRPTLQLKIAGGWENDELRIETLRFIDRENLDACVHFVGTVSGHAKAEFLASGDIFCLPTQYKYEGQPLAILEALSGGLPVFATTHAALSSTAPDGFCGRLVNPKSSPAEMAATIGRMLDNRVDLENFSRNARKLYLEKYTLQACHARLREVFATVNARKY
jgi:glycosyltransferase involved in cell wall biosynthesis